jgi:hypothetical protein
MFNNIGKLIDLYEQDHYQGNLDRVIMVGKYFHFPNLTHSLCRKIYHFTPLFHLVEVLALCVYQVYNTGEKIKYYH